MQRTGTPGAGEAVDDVLRDLGVDVHQPDALIRAKGVGKVRVLAREGLQEPGH